MALRRKWFDVPPSGIGASNVDEPGQEEREPHCVLNSEPLCDDVLSRVAVRQLCLHARNFGAKPTQRDGCSTQLEDVGHVLGVVDGDDVASGQRQTKVQALGLVRGSAGGITTNLNCGGG